MRAPSAERARAVPKEERRHDARWTGIEDSSPSPVAKNKTRNPAASPPAVELWFILETETRESRVLTEEDAESQEHRAAVGQ